MRKLASVPWKLCNRRGDMTKESVRCLCVNLIEERDRFYSIDCC